MKSFACHPGTISRAITLGGELVMKPARRRVLPVLSIFLTERCAGQCRMCPIHLSDGQAELSFETVVEISRQAPALGMRMALLTGGEPLLHPRLVSIVDELERSADLRVNISTSGVGLDDRIARQLARAGLTAACVSIESDDQDVHDGLRGAGSYAKAVAAVDALRTWAPKTRVSLGMTLSTRNLDRLPRMPELAQRLGAHAIRVQLVRNGFEQQGLAPEIYQDLMLGPSAADELAAALGELRRCAAPLRIRTDSPVYMDDLVCSVRGARRIPCVAGEVACCLTARGQLKPCPNVDVEYPVLQGDIAKAWNSSAFRSFRHRGCEYQDRCTDSTYHNLSALGARARGLELGALLRDAAYFGLLGGPGGPR